MLAVCNLVAMAIRPKDVTWLVEECVQGAVTIHAVADGAPEDECYARFTLVRLGDFGVEDEDWQYSLDWTERPNSGGVGPWRANGLIRPTFDSMRIHSLAVEPTTASTTELPVTAHVLRSVPIGLIHDALHVLSIGQVMYADVLSGDGDLTLEDLRIGAVTIPRRARAEDPARRGRLAGEELLMATQYLGHVGIRRLTRDRPRIDGQVPPGFVPQGEKRPGRPKRSPEELLAFAQDFLAVQGSYASLCAKRGMNPNTAKGWVAACRKAGWLAPGQPGRSGVPSPGPLLIEMEKRASK